MSEEIVLPARQTSATRDKLAGESGRYWHLSVSEGFLAQILLRRPWLLLSLSRKFLLPSDLRPIFINIAIWYQM